jgi:hypothetical protein
MGKLTFSSDEEKDAYELGYKVAMRKAAAVASGMATLIASIDDTSDDLVMGAAVVQGMADAFKTFGEPS